MEDVKIALARVESKVDTILERSSTNEVRIRELEKSKNWFTGALAAMTVVWGVLLKFAMGEK